MKSLLISFIVTFSILADAGTSASQQFILRIEGDKNISVITLAQKLNAIHEATNILSEKTCRASFINFNTQKDIREQAIEPGGIEVVGVLECTTDEESRIAQGLLVQKMKRWIRVDLSQAAGSQLKVYSPIMRSVSGSN